MKKFLVIVTILILYSIILVEAQIQEEIFAKYEFGLNIGSIGWGNNKQSFFGMESSFYPEIGLWTNLSDLLKAGLTTGLIYVGYNNENINRTIIAMPTVLEMGLIYIQPSIELPTFFMELCLGPGSFISLGDIYQNSSITSLKLGLGLMTEGIYFIINVKRIEGKAKTKEQFTYIINPDTKETGVIGPEMPITSDIITVGVGLRY
jgi:hypothetical protein